MQRHRGVIGRVERESSHRMRFSSMLNNPRVFAPVHTVPPKDACLFAVGDICVDSPRVTASARGSGA